jgi:hypothetical protein
MEFKELELSTETIRELSGDELEQVAGGVVNPTGTETMNCPTRGTTFSPCQALSLFCG